MLPRGGPGIILVSLLAAGCGGARPERHAADPILRVALHTEPQTWNRLLATDRVTHVTTEQIHEPLLRLNPETQRMEPALAESWEFSEDGKHLIVHLREDLRFSDGEPLSAEDVVFTFEALYDPRVASPLLDTARIDGVPFGVEVVDETTVAFVLPRRTPTVERVFDSIPILPAHALRESLARGSLPADTGLSVPVHEVVGAGRFRLREHLPGERIVMERNEHYWEDDAPRLSLLVFDIVPDENVRVLRLRSGEVDLVELLTPGAFELLGDQHLDNLTLLDLGPGMMSERLWFNLNPAAPIDEHKKRWFGDVRFRQAVSKAIDRRAMARVVFSGRATPASGPVSIANSFWRDESIPEIERDLEVARALLADAGFRWGSDGGLRDSGGRPVEFTVITRAGDDQHARMGAFLQEDLTALGMGARVVPIEASGLLARLTSRYDYDACLLGITQTDPDPSAEMGFWLSRAPLHLWHPNQSTPATPWEARIDELMERQMRALDPRERQESYFEVQRIVHEQLPVIDLVVPHALVAVRRRVQNLRPTSLTHSLWNSEEIFVTEGAERGEKTTWGIRDSRH